MKNVVKKLPGFTLVELLVVITILSIISVVAYQNFGGAVDKAVSGRKISDVSTIETSLQQYKVDKNYYPAVGAQAADNLWGYDSTSADIATASNQIQVTLNGEEVQTVVSAGVGGGGRIMDDTGTPVQIGAKGTISKNELGKYLTKDLYDPELGDLKVNDVDSSTAGDQVGTMLEDYGIGRYVYSVYRKSANWPSSKEGTSYNIAYTVKDTTTDSYATKIVGDYSNIDSCLTDSTICPETLVGSFDDFLSDGDTISDTENSRQDNYGVPYAVTDFAE